LDSVQVFQLASTISTALPCLITIVLIFASKPKSIWLRSVIAVIFAWVISVAYTAYIYNPLGIAAAIQNGIDSPQMRYDNNTITVQILVGWAIPLFTACIVLIGRMLFLKISQGNIRVSRT
jgi:ABC-type microcin C transport system permease subunit YejB